MKKVQIQKITFVVITVHKIINCYGLQDEKLYLVKLSADG